MDEEALRAELSRIAEAALDLMHDDMLSRTDQRVAVVVFGLVNQLLGKISASGTSGSAQDAEERLGPKGAGPAPEGGDAQ